MLDTGRRSATRSTEKKKKSRADQQARLISRSPNRHAHSRSDGKGHGTTSDSPWFQVFLCVSCLCLKGQKATTRDPPQGPQLYAAGGTGSIKDGQAEGALQVSRLPGSRNVFDLLPPEVAVGRPLVRRLTVGGGGAEGEAFNLPSRGLKCPESKPAPCGKEVKMKPSWRSAQFRETYIWGSMSSHGPATQSHLAPQVRPFATTVR